MSPPTASVSGRDGGPAEVASREAVASWLGRAEGAPRLRHRLIKADAGTGKTYTLTVHFLRLLAAGVDPRRVLATTFTRKAAGEILERILLRVARAALEDREAERLTKDLNLARADQTRPDPGQVSLGCDEYAVWLGQLVDLLPRLSVGTLDSFFRRIVAGFRYELGLVRLRRIAALDDPLVTALRERAVRRTLDRLITGSEPLSALTMRLYRGQAQRSVAWSVDRVFTELYQMYREAPDAEVWAQITVPPGRLSRDRLASALATWHKEWLPEVDSNRKAAEARLGKSLIGAFEKATELLFQEDWQGFLSVGIGKKVDEALLEGHASCSYRNKPLAPELFDALIPLARHARASLIGSLHEQTVATHRLLQVFHDEFARLRKMEGVVLFSDLADLIAHALPSLGIDQQLALAYRLDGKIDHVLLDEFQDTSTVQWNALGLLVDEVLPWGDGTKSLFCVGDVKQSIYGWRGGRPELFEVVESRFEAMEEESASIDPLQESYRSSPVVLDAVNRVFESIDGNRCLEGRSDDQKSRMRAAERWADHFEAHRAAPPREGDPGYVVLKTSRSWEGMFDDEISLEEAAETSNAILDHKPIGHLEFAARQVKALTARRPTAAVGVLVRSNRIVSETLFALRELGVEASGEGQGRITDDEAVTAVISALRLAASPADTASLAHLAITPLGAHLGLTEAFGRLPTDSNRLGRKAVEISQQIRDEVVGRGACSVVADWARALASQLSHRSRARVQQLLEVLIDQRELVDHRPAEIVRLVAETSVEEPAPAQVRVMTIHQAKGLEFDVVVLCELETQLGALYSPLIETMRESPITPPAAVVRASNEVTRKSDGLLIAAHAQEVERRMSDDLSAVYVALTRARSELHMLVQPVAAPPGKRPPLENFSAAGFLRAALCTADRYELRGEPETVLFELGEPLTDQRDTDPSQEPPLERSSAGHEGDGESEGAGSRKPKAERDSASPFQAGTKPIDLSASELDALLGGGERSGLVRGQLLHAYLAEVDWLSQPSISRELWNRVCGNVAPLAQSVWLERVERELQGIVRAPAILELFRKPTSIKTLCWREQPFALAGGERGVIDRVVLTLDASDRVKAAHVIDWKTGAGSDLHDAYAAQLETYRRAVADLVGLVPTGVRASIVWLDRLTIEDL